MTDSNNKIYKNKSKNSSILHAFQVHIFLYEDKKVQKACFIWGNRDGEESSPGAVYTDCPCNMHALLLQLLRKNYQLLIAPRKWFCTHWQSELFIQVLWSVLGPSRGGAIASILFYSDSCFPKEGGGQTRLKGSVHRSDKWIK